LPAGSPRSTASTGRLRGTTATPPPPRRHRQAPPRTAELPAHHHRAAAMPPPCHRPTADQQPPHHRSVPAVRLPAGLRPPSTDSVTFFRPHLGDWEVVPILSTGQAVEESSGQVSRLWIRGRTISTACGRRAGPQAVHQVVHGQPTGCARLSPAIPSFSTPLSTVRQHNAPPHRVE
jgi:hypothetical protein